MAIESQLYCLASTSLIYFVPPRINTNRFPSRSMGLIDDFTTVIVETWYGSQRDPNLERDAEEPYLRALSAFRSACGNLSRVLRPVTDQWIICGDDSGPEMQGNSRSRFWFDVPNKFALSLVAYIHLKSRGGWRWSPVSL
jgi:hypothetical protein